MIFEGHTNNITAVSFHLEGKWLVTGSEDGTIKIWDLRWNLLHAWSLGINSLRIINSSGQDKCTGITTMVYQVFLVSHFSLIAYPDLRVRSERRLYPSESRGIDIMRSSREHKAVGPIGKCLHVRFGQKFCDYPLYFPLKVEIGTCRRRPDPLSDHSVVWVLLGGGK